MWSNLANHVLSLCHKHWDGHVPDVDESALRPADLDLIAATQNGFNPVGAELKTIDSLKVMFSLFLPYTSEKLHTFLGNETPLFGEQYVEEIQDSLSTHNGLKYRGIEGIHWKPSELKPGQKLNQPAPLFKKLEDSVVEEERARLGN